MQSRRRSIRSGDCVRITDGRIGRLRSLSGARYRIRVRRRTSKTHEFITIPARDVRWVECPKGWMSPGGYIRYLRATLAKMRDREAAKVRERERRRRKAGR